MDVEFAAVSVAADLSYKEALEIATNKVLNEKLQGARFRHERGETKIVNLNVVKGIRSTDKKIQSIALPKSNVFVLKSGA